MEDDGSGSATEFGNCVLNAVRRRTFRSRLRQFDASAIATSTPDWMVRFYEKQRPGAAEVLDTNQKQRIIAMVWSDPPEGRARWPCDWWPKKPSNDNWCRASEERPFESCCCTTTSGRGGKKMWCVADLTDEYVYIQRKRCARIEQAGIRQDLR